jgi:serine/threonine protein phosphatase PrpC
MCDRCAARSCAGLAVALSEDHKPLQEGERARIEAAGGTVTDVGGVARINGNLNLSRAIGDLKYKTNEGLPREAQIITAQPDVRVFELTADDRFFILACDGVWDVLSNQVRSSPWPRACVRACALAACKAGCRGRMLAEAAVPAPSCDWGPPY